MEKKIVTKSLRQLDQVVLHGQVENGTTISNNLIANQIDQQFETIRNSFRQNKDIHGQKRDMQATKHFKKH